MNDLRNLNMSYLQEEINTIKRIFLTLSNPDIIASYEQQIMELEEAFLQLRVSTRNTTKLRTTKRQEFPLSNQQLPIAPTGNIPPPSPTPFTPSPSLPPIPTDVIIPDRGFTLAELSTSYNGLNGNPSYVAFNGVIFDVSNIATWGGGTHFGLFAGTDVTPGARACGFHIPIDLMRILPPVGYLETPAATPTEPTLVPPISPMIPTAPTSPITPMPPTFPTTPTTPISPISPTTPTTPTTPISPTTPTTPTTPIFPTTPMPPTTPTTPTPPISPITPTTPMPPTTPTTPTPPITPTTPTPPITPVPLIPPITSPSSVPSLPPITPTPDITIPVDFPIPTRSFTLQELKNHYNGEDGRPAYIAICGIVFDVTNSSSWHRRNRFGLYPGNDLTHKLPSNYSNALSHIAKIFPAMGRIREI